MDNLADKLSWEISHGRDSGKIICGIDEVGRGPLAGPVVACAVILPQKLDDPLWGKVTDSKKLSAPRRTELAKFLRQHCAFAIAEASVAEIDDINILQATFLAMRRAVEKLSSMPGHTPPHHALVDGNKIPPLPCPATAVVKGDALSLSIGAASILAKVYRDELMKILAAEHPAYGWDANAGYGTATHLKALRKFGTTRYHRQLFVRRIMAELSTTEAEEKHAAA